VTVPLWPLLNVKVPDPPDVVRVMLDEGTVPVVTFFVWVSTLNCGMPMPRPASSAPGRGEPFCVVMSVKQPSVAALVDFT